MEHNYSTESHYPSDKTLNIIRQLAYSLNLMKYTNQQQYFC